MVEELKKNIESIKCFFKDKKDAESKYLAIIDLGRKLPPLEDEYKVPINKVEGCQSTTYIYSYYENGLLHFRAESDALISSGLAALMICVYDNQPPEVIINNPPDFLLDLGIHGSLSPNRANGLAQIYLRMKQDASKYL